MDMAVVGSRTALLACGLVLSLACSGDRQGSGDDASTRGTVIVAFNAETQSFNPLVNTDQNTNEVNYYMLFTPLVGYDERFEPVPYLARSWELEPGAVTFQLHDDVRWHDGFPVTAYDVAFTFRRAKDPETASVLASAYLDRVSAVQVIDSFTVRFEFSEPHARPLDGFWWPPVPQHLLEDVPASELVRAGFNRQPVGSGPFRFVSWQSGASVTLERNLGFPESLGGPPQVDRVVIRFIGDASTLLAETLTGGIDINGSLFPDQTERVEATPGVRLLAWPSREYYYIGWNTRNPQLSDPRIRRALTQSIDRQQLIDVLLFRRGRLATGTIAPWHPMYEPIAPLPFDPAAAAASLDSAGWRDRDGDGVREDADGVPFRFTLMTNHENPVRVDIAQVVQSALARVGVPVDVRTLEWQTLLTRHRAREFDAVVQSWVLDNFRVEPFSLFHSSQADLPGSYNRSGLKDERVDRLMEQAMRAADPDSARQGWTEFALALQQAQPFTFLMWLDDLAVVSDRVQNVTMDARGTLVGVAEWTVDGRQ
jgi:peptide/nickel transport system substrate-binding protein